MLDTPIENAFSLISHVSSSAQVVDTSVSFPDRVLLIAGTYLLDYSGNRFSSFSTTTLVIPNAGKHTFSHNDIAVGGDVYVAVATGDPLLTKTITQTHGWKHFVGNAIPREYFGIAVDGPVEDNLAVLGNNGSYLKLTHKYGLDATFGASLLRYQFTLSNTAPQDTGGPLSAELGRIGNNGVVDVWLEENGTPRYLRFVGPQFISTTSLASLNTLPPIVAPLTL